MNVPQQAVPVKDAVLRTAKDHYRQVNALWPAGPLPKMTGEEAVRAAKRLWRRVMGKAWAGTWKAGRGNHRTYPRGRTFIVNPGQGWHDMVHDLSHAAHRRLNRHGKPHDGGHARIEAEMIRMVLAEGWLDGRLRPAPKPEKPKVSLRDQRYQRAKAALDRAKHRRDLAEAAIARLTPKVRKYERDIARTSA